MLRKLRGRRTSANTAGKPVSSGDTTSVNSDGDWITRITKHSPAFDNSGSMPSAAQACGRWFGALRVEIEPAQIRVFKQAGWGATAPVQIAAVGIDGGATEQMAAALGRALAAAKGHGRRVDFALADQLTRLFIVQPPLNASALRDLEAAAAARFRSLYDSPPAGWRIEADWRADRPFLACAVRDDMIAALTDVVSVSRLMISGIVPRFVAAWNRWHRILRPNAWFAMAYGSVLTLAALQEGTVASIRTVSMPPDEAQFAAWLAAHVQRESLRLGLPAPSLVQLCGELPPGFADQHMEGISLHMLQALATPGVGKRQLSSGRPL